MTANDSDVSDGYILTGSQVVRVYGQNLTAPFVTLTFGDVEYTPLTQGEGYIEFILGDNGTATISVDGSRFMSFEVEGIVVPSILPTNFIMFQSKTGGAVEHVLRENDVNCINYPLIIDSDALSVTIRIGSENEPIRDLSADDFDGNNCNITLVGNTGEYQVGIRLEITNANDVAWVTYQGFIIAVFNYTTE